MAKLFKKLHWADALIIVALTVFVATIWLRIDGTLNYKWNWSIIPRYIIRWDEHEGVWVANILLQGLISTIRVSIYAGILAVIIGVLLGIARCAQNLTLRLLARTYVECLRNIPPIVVIFIFYFFLSEQVVSAFGIEKWARGIARSENPEVWSFFFGDMRHFPSLISGVVVLAMFESAFVGEIVRSGIQSVGIGQREAARALGLGWVDEMRFVVLPQAIKRVLPPLANQFITLVKDSSIISLIAIQELTYKTSELVVSTRAIFEAWLTTAAFYFIICFSLSMLFRKFEKKRSAT
ncbi:amino acid ABC transporter permease [Pseudovibrio sp. Tun.PSC04-5.I4]|uniref:amino acid ABC transporter permease n=1 Tax=Pseudovibrio sp. Tun.PSC04-5.I4 TaxID=1798213 RepID=UPI000886FF02|nr:amino acid ABC transporter permease [Pseudovibrio sp. Tun.PSC04-5.I4]SDQ18591.1 amino acid ABC transporter membrane protein 2, PAAT family [Pseudovibrio sp. Tun.PSC04-5.I4]